MSNKKNPRQAWAQVVAQAWTDTTFKRNLTANPRQTLEECGLELPADVKIKLVENSSKKQFLHIPLKSEDVLSETELKKAAAACYGLTNTESKKWAQLLSQLWSDKKLLANFRAHPEKVLQEHDISLPKGIQYEVVEDTENAMYFVLPAKPNQKMSETDLRKLAAAASTIWHCP